METLFIGKKYYSFQELPSTNTWLMESLVALKLPEGTLVLADHQTEGKGQFGAIWSSEPSSSLTFSILLKPIFLPISNTYDISICVALAIHDCLNELRPGFKIKWPKYGAPEFHGLISQAALCSTLPLIRPAYLGFDWRVT